MAVCGLLLPIQFCGTLELHQPFHPTYASKPPIQLGRSPHVAECRCTNTNMGRFRNLRGLTNRYVKCLSIHRELQRMADWLKYKLIVETCCGIARRILMLDYQSGSQGTDHPTSKGAHRNFRPKAELLGHLCSVSHIGRLRIGMKSVSNSAFYPLLSLQSYI
jgi:hypothetical protein